MKKKQTLLFLCELLFLFHTWVLMLVLLQE
jgi:hypothetical protein